MDILEEGHIGIHHLDLGHFIDTLNYLATSTPKSSRFLITFSWIIYIGLPHVLVLTVNLVNFFSWVSQGGHSEQLLFFALFYQSTPSCLKVMGGVGWNEQSGMLV